MIVIDAVPSRLDEARRFGAEHVIDMTQYATVEARVEAVRQLTGGRGADFGMELTGVLAAYPEGMQLIRPGGTMVAMGTVNPGQTIAYDPAYAVRHGVSTLALVRYNGPYLKKSLDFLAANRGKYPFDSLLDKDYRLDEIVQALDDSAARKVTRASIVMPH